MRRRWRPTAALAALLSAAAPLPAVRGVGPVVDAAIAPDRASEPVVLTGESFGGWAAPAELNAEAPHHDALLCFEGDNDCTHNRYEEPDVATGDALGSGVPVGALLGFRWSTEVGRWVEVPLQVDERAVRYLSNNASTFSPYSQTDQHLSYVWDEERFRWTAPDPRDPCRAVPRDGVRTTPDPVAGLDTDDEVVFMARDAGPAAPAGASPPRGIASLRRLTVVDPYRPGAVRHLYVGLAAGGRRPSFHAGNGYVRYEPDPDADRFERSESSYESYGNAPKGAWFDPASGRCITDRPLRHRPRDTAWVRTPTYAFRYDGRWLMTALRVAAPGRPWEYGPDIVDQWKARAYQQRPGGETPCCGYEEEVTNWGGSSTLLGVRRGPVRVIRSTWGSDSATNNVRTEIFYRDEIRQGFNLRVHAIPPFDGIYAQWDYNAGRVTRYFNPWTPAGARVDGRHDEVLGNTRMRIASDGVHVTDDDPVPLVGPIAVGAGSEGRCPDDVCVNNDIDVPDPAFSGPLAALNYEQVTGPHGTLVHRSALRRMNVGAGYSIAAVPYYRDDACFDDGTGSDPGPHVKSRSPDPAVDSTGRPRRCWTPGTPVPATPADSLYQGSIGTHGLHIELIVDSDNAFTTLPLTEIDTETRIVVLRGERPNVGEAVGRATEKPLVVTVT